MAYGDVTITPAEDNFLRRRAEDFGIHFTEYHQLRAQYSDEKRHYHNVYHLLSCLHVIDEMKAALSSRRYTIEQLQQLGLAIFYHDCVYVPGQRHNEERSLIRMLYAWKQGLIKASPETIRGAGRLILLSKTHSCADGDELGRLFSMVDLAILTRSRSDYEAYRKSVSTEYKGKVFLFSLRRKRVLKQILKSHPFPQGSELASNLAANIQNELSELDLANDLQGMKWSLTLLVLGAFCFLSTVGWKVFLGITIALLILGTRMRRFSRMCHQNLARRLAALLKNLEIPIADWDQRTMVWLALSELYLDTEPDLDYAAALIRRSNYPKSEVLKILQGEIGPLLAGNLGWGIYPTFGEWGAFDKRYLQEELLFRTLCEVEGPASRILRFMGEMLSTWFIRSDLKTLLKKAYCSHSLP